MGIYGNKFVENREISNETAIKCLESTISELRDQILLDEEVEIIEEGINHDIWKRYKEANKKFKSLTKSARKKEKDGDFKGALEDIKEAKAEIKKGMEDIDKLDYTTIGSIGSALLDLAKQAVLIIPTLGMYSMYNLSITGDAVQKDARDLARGNINSKQYWNYTRRKFIHYMRLALESLDDYAAKLKNEMKQNKIIK